MKHNGYDLGEFKRVAIVVEDLVEFFSSDRVSGVYRANNQTIHLIFGNPVSFIVEILACADGRIGVNKYVRKS